jgi:hypothetical protein
MLGDFNARIGRACNESDVIGKYGEDAVNDNGNMLLEIVRPLEMMMLNGRKEGDVEWTYMNGGTGGKSVVDLCVVTKTLQKDGAVLHVDALLDIGGDGHRPIWVEFPWSRSCKKASKPCERWRYRVEKLEDAKCALEFSKAMTIAMEEWTTKHRHADFDEDWLAWHKSFMAVCDAVIGKKKVKKNRKEVVHNNEIKTVVEMRKQMWCSGGLRRMKIKRKRHG